ncbi:MAG: hypothetical protein JWN04_3281, partial [Myxococcaceae bacterium]|nr:hypothetical protein [Myxococcaceae bacterium]
LTATLSPGYLGIHGETRGDQFPSSEAFLEDSAGTRRMLQSFDTAGGTMGPVTHLPGNRQAPMTAMCNAFSITDSGQFR